MISALAINCLNPARGFVDLGWQSVSALLESPHAINDSSNAHDRK